MIGGRNNVRYCIRNLRFIPLHPVYSSGKPMRAIVCGGRDYADRDVFWNTLDYHEPSVIISGGARGADSLAIEYAQRYKIPLEIYTPNWSVLGKKAGVLRNQDMIDLGKPDVVIAFPGGVGTADMVRRAKKAGIPVIKGGKHDSDD